MSILELKHTGCCIGCISKSRTNDEELTDLTEVLERKEKERIKYYTSEALSRYFNHYFFASYQCFSFFYFLFLIKSVLVTGVFLEFFCYLLISCFVGIKLF